MVRNTRTQTSPQESISSEESPLQTPLPRKRPPIPISRYDWPRSRAKGPRSDADRRAEKKARVRFESDISPRLLSYKKEMTHKGRLVSLQGIRAENDKRQISRPKRARPASLKKKLVA